MQYQLNLHGVSRCLSGGTVFAAKSIRKIFNNQIWKENILPNNDFKYSVALSGVFTIDERPNRKNKVLN